MVGTHELTFEEAVWLAQMSRGRLLKNPIDLGMPDHVRTALLMKGLAMAHGGLLEITPEGLVEAMRRGDPPTQDVLTNRAPVMLLVSPTASEPPAANEDARARQRRLSADLLLIAVDAAIIDHEVAKLDAATPAAGVPADAAADGPGTQS